MNINKESFHHFLDTNKKEVLDINHVCRKENQAEFIELLKERSDYKWNGLNIRKLKQKDQLQEIDEFFSNFDFESKQQYELPYGFFTPKTLKQFATNFISCAKQNKTNYQGVSAKLSLVKLMEYLSGQTVKCTQQRQHSTKQRAIT
jgi:hypothetical protein